MAARLTAPGSLRVPSLKNLSCAAIYTARCPARLGTFSLTLTPVSPWHAAQTAEANRLPAIRSPACADCSRNNGMTKRNAIFMASSSQLGVEIGTFSSLHSRVGPFRAFAPIGIQAHLHLAGGGDFLTEVGVALCAGTHAA